MYTHFLLAQYPPGARNRLKSFPPLARPRRYERGKVMMLSLLHHHGRM